MMSSNCKPCEKIRSGKTVETYQCNGGTTETETMFSLKGVTSNGVEPCKAKEENCCKWEYCTNESMKEQCCDYNQNVYDGCTKKTKCTTDCEEPREKNCGEICPKNPDYNTACKRKKIGVDSRDAAVKKKCSVSNCASPPAVCKTPCSVCEQNGQDTKYPKWKSI